VVNAAFQGTHRAEGDATMKDEEPNMPKGLAVRRVLPRLVLPITLVAITALAATTLAQAPKLAPADASSTGRVAPAGEPGPPLMVTGVVVDANGAPVPGVSLYIYQTDAEGYYGVKPQSDSANPRLKLFLRSDARGAFSFGTIRPGAYPNSRAPGHIHFEVSAAGFAPKIFEIVFEGDPFVTDAMRKNPAFSVRPVEAGGRVTERIVLTR
jgi:protocatechuate 3,4-dioxygenase beta subunit